MNYTSIPKMVYGWELEGRGPQPMSWKQYEYIRLRGILTSKQKLEVDGELLSMERQIDFVLLEKNSLVRKLSDVIRHNINNT